MTRPRVGGVNLNLRMFDGDDLMARAERAAVEGTTALERTEPVLAFLWGQELYGLPISDVREVAKLSAVTPIPGLPPSLLGAMNLRGEILPVVDVRAALGLAPGTVARESRLVVVSLGSERVGILTDGIGDIYEVETGARKGATAELVTRQTVLGSGALLNHLDLSLLLKSLGDRG